MRTSAVGAGGECRAAVGSATHPRTHEVVGEAVGFGAGWEGAVASV